MLTSMIQGWTEAGYRACDAGFRAVLSGWLVPGGGGAARYARGGTGSDCAGTGLLSGSQGRGGWSGGLWQGAQPFPAGQERLLPGAGAADLQHAGAGMADEPGREAEQPVAQRVRFGVLEIVLVVQACIETAD